MQNCVVWSSGRVCVCACVFSNTWLFLIRCFRCFPFSAIIQLIQIPFQVKQNFINIIHRYGTFTFNSLRRILATFLNRKWLMAFYFLCEITLTAIISFPFRKILIFCFPSSMGSIILLKSPSRRLCFSLVWDWIKYKILWYMGYILLFNHPIWKSHIFIHVKIC